jgi:arginase
MVTGRALGLLGVPSSMGAFAPGQEDAPSALRAAGLADQLRAAGISVADLGDLPHRRWTPDPASPAAQNVRAVAEVTRAVSARVHDIAERPLLVLGGDCSIEIGVVAGHAEQDGRLGLLYVDLHADLNTPSTTDQGALDWMVVSHLVGAPGTIAGITDPLLAPDQVHYFGVDQNRLTPGERDLLADLDITVTTSKRIARDPVGAAREAKTRMARFDHLLIHFDVDLVDFNDLPLSENAGRNQGLPLRTVMTALAELLAAPNLRALTVTELNPHHGAADGSTVRRFTEALVGALAVQEGELGTNRQLGGGP